MNNQQSIARLIERGVIIPCPASVEVGDEVIPERIASGVVIHTGCKILGAQTSIGPGSVIGAESPMTIEDCQLGRKVALKGGFASGATFLDGANIGSGAQIRPGTLLEEEANGAHTVGLKQTVFLPFVTAGSLINFCDALMAGGTSRKDHSEIGSSYIHFNYTPHQDKATASLIGDVPRGVMLDQAPIFLGGQGGLVGPVRIEYGTVLPAGVICREDVLESNQVYAPPATIAARGARKFRPGAYRAIRRIVTNNLIYIGNIRALTLWYRFVRQRVMSSNPFTQACFDGAMSQLDIVLEERIKRLKELASKMSQSLDYAEKHSDLGLPPALRLQQQALRDRWPEMESLLRAGPSNELGAPARDEFLAVWESLDRQRSYIEAIATLPQDAKRQGANWLQAVVDAVAALDSFAA